MFKKLGSASLESWDPWELDGPEFAPGGHATCRHVAI